MGKKFDDNTRSTIKKSVDKISYEMFCSNGYKKTTVNKVVDAVGIAKGTFYLFYSSKEELFFKLLLDKEKEMNEQLISELSELSKRLDFVHAFKEVLKKNIIALGSSPFMAITFESELMLYVYSKIPENMKNESITNDIKRTERQVALGEEHGYTITQNADVVSSCLRVAVFSLLNKDLLSTNSDEIMDTILLGTLKELFVKN